MKQLFILVFTLALLMLTSNIMEAQSNVNFELQVYPTGIIPGVRVEHQLSEKTLLHLRAGFNIFDHRDLGVQDEETGWGYGFTVGASHQLKESKFDLGIRNDIWFNNVDWVSLINTPAERRGETSITVIQPTVELTYKLTYNKFSIRPSLAFGLEWNVRTEGEPTGEGAIVLLGIIVGGM